MDFSNQLTTPVSAIDTGLLCLAAICRFHQLPVEPAQLAREYGASFDAVTLQRAAKALGLRCKPTGVLRAAPNSPPPSRVRTRSTTPYCPPSRRKKTAATAFWRASKTTSI
jgi:hypothetical protein